MTASAKYTDRMMELLVQRATDGLSASEQLELNRLLGQGQHSDRDQFEQTAAALLLAGIGEEEPLPDSLKTKLMAQAETFTLQMPRPSVVNMPLAEPAATPAPTRRAVAAKPGSQRFAWFAAAAGLLLAVAAWLPRLETDTDPKHQREGLIGQAETLQRNWTATEDPAAKGVTGDVVWNQATQVGYMRFRGLAANNPHDKQYQLWIFDGERNEKHPVDGGVFDVPGDQSEVVIPITARLKVRKPSMFAVTLEEAGGTVVSEREHILVLAKVAT